MMTGNLCIRLICALCITALAVQASVTVVTDTPRELTFIFKIEGYTLNKYRENSRVLSFGSANAVGYTKDREPLALLALNVGVPQQGDVSITITPTSTETITLDGPLFSVPKNEKIDGGTFAPQGAWRSRVDYTHFRNLRAAQFFINPFYREGNRVTVLKEGRVTIRFPQSRGTKGRFEGDTDGDYYGMLKNEIINFNTAQQWLKRNAPVSRSEEVFVRDNQRNLYFKIGDGHVDKSTGRLNETTTFENRVIKLTKSDLDTIFRFAINFDDIGILASQKTEIDTAIPSSIDSIPTGTVRVPFVKVDNNSNGVMEDGDFILLYVTGNSDWAYNPTSRLFEYQFNHIDSYRNYWIVVDKEHSRTVPKFTNGTSATGEIVRAFKNRIRYKKSNSLMSDQFGETPYGSMEWRWFKMYEGSLSHLLYPITLPDYDGDGQMRLGAGYTEYNSFMKSSFTGSTTLTDDNDKWYPIMPTSDTLALTLEYPQDTTKFPIYELDYIDFTYKTNLTMSGKNFLRIYSQESEKKVITYNVTNVPTNENTLVLRLRGNTEEEMTVVYNGVSNGTLQWIDTTGIGVQYIITNGSAYNDMTSKPTITYNNPSANSSTITNLHNEGNGSDFLVITTEEFLGEAQRFVDIKKQSGRFVNPRIVFMKDIYREFSGGTQSPSALRNFLMYAVKRWNGGNPDYALLLGNGHYDYKHYQFDEPIHIPVLERKTDCEEGFYTFLTPVEESPRRKPDIYLGRVPVITQDDAKNFVDKVYHMDISDSSDGVWRNSMLLLSDDDQQGDGGDFIRHYEDNEEIALNVEELYRSIHTKKLLLFEHKWDNNFQKPTAASELTSLIDNGVALLNFFGHGNDEAWTDERILTNEQLPQFNNKYRYPTICSFSCSVGKFDKPGVYSMGDKFVMLKDKGAIVSLASTRIAYAGSNANMAKAFFNFLYDPEKNYTVGQAYGMTKINNYIRNYVLFGDPSTRYFKTNNSISVSIHSKKDNSIVDTVKALQKIVIRGEVRNNGVVNSSFGTSTKPGYVNIGIFRPDQDSTTRKDGGSFLDPEPFYTLPGKQIRGSVVPVVNGRFSAEYLIPRRIPFNEIGSNIKTFAWQTAKGAGGKVTKQFAAGKKEDFIFSGSETDGAVNDTVGPVILIRPMYKQDSIAVTENTNDDGQVIKKTDTLEVIETSAFTHKLVAALPLPFQIVLEDENGVDVTGSGPGEGLTYEIIGATDVRSIPGLVFDNENSTRGVASVNIDKTDNIRPGKYTLIIRAQDMLGNTSKKEFELEILSDEEFKISQVFHYPNPVRMGQKVRFFFNHTNLSTVTGKSTLRRPDITVRIFTLSGRLIRVFNNVRHGVQWDLTDQTGNALPPNVYLYRVYARIATDGFSDARVEKSAVKKIVIHPRPRQ